MKALPFPVGIEHEVSGSRGEMHYHDEECYEIDCDHECDDYCRQYGCDHDCYAAGCAELVCDLDEEEQEPDSVPGWRLVTDGSCGWEYVSEVIRSEERLQELVRRIFEDVEWEQSDTCGCHIHVGSLQFPAVHALARLWRVVEADVIKWAQPRDERGSWCQPWYEVFEFRPLPSKADIYSLKRWYYGEEDETSTRYHPKRYLTLNLNSWFYRGTVEFRLFNSCVTQKELLKRVDFCLFICWLACEVAYGLELSRAVEMVRDAIRADTFDWRSLLTQAASVEEVEEEPEEEEESPTTDDIIEMLFGRRAS